MSARKLSLRQIGHPRQGVQESSVSHRILALIAPASSPSSSHLVVMWERNAALIKSRTDQGGEEESKKRASVCAHVMTQRDSCLMTRQKSQEFFDNNAWMDSGKSVWEMLDACVSGRCRQRLSPDCGQHNLGHSDLWSLCSYTIDGAFGRITNCVPPV